MVLHVVCKFRKPLNGYQDGVVKMPTVNELIEELDQKLRALASLLRTIVKKALLGSQEFLNPWGVPVYKIRGEQVACLMHYSKHLNLGFF